MMLRCAMGAALAATAVAVNKTAEDSRCTIGAKKGSCEYTNTVLQERDVLHMIPEGTAPKDGWPVLMLFHGWNCGGKSAWKTSSAGSTLNKIKLKAAFLDAGYAVFAPDSNMYRDGGYWETNIDPYASADLEVWEQSDDHRFLTALFQEMSEGLFGPVNVNNMHSVGFSSGGFMSSRMAFNYAKKFRSISIQSGGPAWCDGWWCPEDVFESEQPQAAMKSHPPTLFLHGSKDTMCYPKYAEDYHDRLQKAGIATHYVSEAVGHQWFDDSATEVLKWVKKYSK